MKNIILLTIFFNDYCTLCDCSNVYKHDGFCGCYNGICNIWNNDNLSSTFAIG